MEKILLSLEEIQRSEYEILKAFHAFCEHNQLTYYLCGGTLLGAVRHHGFIPWDDDIDIMMPRPDYIRFLQLASGGGMGKEFAVDSYETHDAFCVPGLLSRIYNMKTESISGNYDIPYAIGVPMDISVIDGLPSTKMARWLHFKKMFLLARIHSYCIIKKTAKLNSRAFNVIKYALLPVRPLLRLAGLKNYQRWMDKLNKKYQFENSEYVGVVNGRASVRETMKRSHLEPYVTVIFEDQTFHAMANYDEYLTNMYGDYMTPPPESERTLRHRSQVYWRDLSAMDSSEMWWLKE